LIAVFTRVIKRPHHPLGLLKNKVLHTACEVVIGRMPLSVVMPLYPTALYLRNLYTLPTLVSTHPSVQKLKRNSRPHPLAKEDGVHRRAAGRPRRRPLRGRNRTPATPPLPHSQLLRRAGPLLPSVPEAVRQSRAPAAAARRSRPGPERALEGLAPRLHATLWRVLRGALQQLLGSGVARGERTAVGVGRGWRGLGDGVPSVLMVLGSGLGVEGLGLGVRGEGLGVRGLGLGVGNTSVPRRLARRSRCAVPRRICAAGEDCSERRDGRHAQDPRAWGLAPPKKAAHRRAGSPSSAASCYTTAFAIPPPPSAKPRRPTGPTPSHQLARGGPSFGAMQDERKHGFSTEQFPVSAYVGSSQNLKDLKDGTLLDGGIAPPRIDPEGLNASSILEKVPGETCVRCVGVDALDVGVLV